ncbi:MAG: hypothetical protein LC795_12100 [Acidobacteria bacterium]|nr:hypothetical protein [Acidobacteriota bacterium]
MMRCFARVAFLMILCASAADAQQGGGRKQQYVLVPPELGIAAVASQPDCPVQFENVRLLVNVNGRGEHDFRLRNRGKKPIRNVIYAWWSTEATGSTGAWFGKHTDEVVMPGQLVPLEGADKDYEIVPLTEELRDKLKLRGPERAGIVTFIVVKVTFADGTTYDAGQMSEALRAYTVKLAGFEDEDEDSKKPQK